MVCSIYKIVNSINEKVYVGQTWNTIDDRFKKHKYSSNNCVKLKNAFDKYGRENFSIELLTVCSTQEVADCLESFFIEKYNTLNNGYNVNEGGKTGGRKGTKHSPETIDRITKAAKRRKLSEETKRKVSLAMSNREFTQDHKNNLSKRRKGATWKMVDGKRVWSLNEK